MTSLLLSLALLTPAADPEPQKTPPEGVLPVGTDGKPLNLDFETGTLKDWTAEGDAFRGQPVRGDTVNVRRGDMRSRHQGEYWIGGYEKLGDKPRGTLTSVPFKVTHPWASFLVGGGAHAETRVELAIPPGGEVIFRASGLDEEDMKRVVVDLSRYRGMEIQIRIVDQHTGGWGHINFDDFRFHSEKPQFPARPTQALKPDEYKYSGLDPEKAAAVMTVPEGFEVRLFAGEPDVHQPIGFCLDDRGRLWVAEAYTYPRRHPHPGPILPDADKAKGDRIVIFEDTDGDGKHDKRTVFMEGLNLVSGIEVGFGGVWIGAAPYLLFVPHDPKTDRPAGEPQILLDGWGYQDTHETLNSFIWGPDGWLYGCHGVFTHSRVGKPGTPDRDRVPINAGIWRYHPTRHVFEVFAHGTSNPWGLDYNDVGDWFIEACVIPHCYHIVQGGRYERQAGQHFNPYTYADIKTIADHRHYAGPNPHGGNNKSDSMGGGHAHCGLMCYLGGTWPQEYRGQLFMGNIHGRRINMDIPEPKGSGYVAKHGKDFLLANDEWARFINLRYGPDGNVYLIDWYDKQACHHNDPKIWDRTNGRIYKVVYKGARPVVGIDLQKCSDEELVKYQLHENDWYVRHARRILQERAVSNEKASAAVRDALTKIATEHKDENRRLRGLWALHVTGGLPESVVNAAFRDPSEHIRAWDVLLTAMEAPTASLPKILAETDRSPVVRRAIASVVPLLPKNEQSEVVFRLLLKNPRPEDASDHNLPCLYWYALEPLLLDDPMGGLTLAKNSEMPLLLQFAARRVGAIGTPEAIGTLIKALSKATSADTQVAYLRGIQEGLRGKRHVQPQPGWSDMLAQLQQSDDTDIRSQALAIGVAFGDERALTIIRKTLTDAAATPAARQAALSSLLDARDRELAGILQKLLGDATLRSAAIRGLAAFDDPQTPAVLIDAYPKFAPAEKRDALNTLAARPAYARALLDAIADKKIPAADVPAEIIRQLRNLGDRSLDERITTVWGTVRDTPADRKRIMASWQKRLTAPNQGAPDLALGRAVFARVCQQCHTLYGVGGKVGPDITGANRADLNYLLENIFDPSAVVPKEYAATKIDLLDGRSITGIVKEETDRTLTVATANETLTIAVADIDTRTPSPLSMMPDDLTQQATEAEIRALFAYLRHPVQVPILATQDTAKEFFNGKDLTGWEGHKDLWSIENGEIVGKAPKGLAKNEFLKSQTEVRDFRLTLKVKLVPDKENSGIQFRSEVLPDGDVKGPQADIGASWWGKLYDEHGRGLIWDKPGDQHVKKEEWNDYVIEANGSKVRTWINGQLCVDLDDPNLSRRGIVAFQLHSGGPMEIRFKDIKLEVLGEKK
jgi:putative membrane-bound dehydrogenase-like protein